MWNVDVNQIVIRLRFIWPSSRVADNAQFRTLVSRGCCGLEATDLHVSF